MRHACLVLVLLRECLAFSVPAVPTPCRCEGKSMTRRACTLRACTHSIRSLECQATTSRDTYSPTPPPISPATKLPNNVWMWRGQQIRYQVAGPRDAEQVAVLVHGLFVNADHWRRTLTGLAEAGYRVYALDLLGSGWSSKPPRHSDVAKRLNGENGRFEGSSEDEPMLAGKTRGPPVLKDIELGTAAGGSRVADVDLRHPLGSPYNFYTWSEQIADFTREIVADVSDARGPRRATLVANSIGSISALQCALDCPQLFDGVCIVNPNFRELHSAEIPLPQLAMPVIRAVQKQLRERGQGLFDALAKPGTVAQILKEPYAVTSAIDDELVAVLLDPLLTPGASDVVFDTLSYSAGPLPEQQLTAAAFPDIPVWVLYGKEDPWTPAARVQRLSSLATVEKVVALEGVGHCPHDESPQLVNPILVQFLQRVKTG